MDIDNQREGRRRNVEVAGIDLRFRTVEVADDTPTGRQVLAACDLSPHSDYIILQWLPGGDLEEIRLEEQLDRSASEAPRVIVAKADRTYRLQLDDRSLAWPASQIGENVLRLLGKVPAGETIFLRLEDEEDRPIDKGSSVPLTGKDTEVFYAKASAWKLNVQGVVVTFDQPHVQVRDALEKAGFDTAAAWIIILKTASERRQVELNDTIDLRESGIEKLRLTPREINNGEAMQPVRSFRLLPADEAGLDQRGLTWSTLLDGGRRWLLIENMRLPAGYTAAAAAIAMEIPVSYPMAEIDMFYCYPAISRADGLPIPQTEVLQPIADRSFQRWSRHRGYVAPWRPGFDSVLTHLALVDASLTREVE